MGTRSPLMKEKPHAEEHALHRPLGSSFGPHYDILFINFASPLNFILRKWNLRRTLIVKEYSSAHDLQVWAYAFITGFSDKELKLTKEILLDLIY